MIALDRKFSAPKSNDWVQWKKVQYLVNNGFLFQSVYEPQQENGKYAGHRRISYPKTLEEAIEFVAAYKHLIKSSTTT